MVNGIFIALGANLGDRAAALHGALHELQAGGDIRVQRCSALLETRPQGGPPGQPDYLNAVARLETDLPPGTLLGRLQALEDRYGRQRTVRNGPRTLDLDLLLYHDEVIIQPELVVPHPRLLQRDFVMRPLAELCTAAELDDVRELALLTSGEDGCLDVAGDVTNGVELGRSSGAD